MADDAPPTGCSTRLPVADGVRTFQAGGVSDSANTDPLNTDPLNADP